MTSYFERYMHGDGSRWNYQFCYGDSVRLGAHMDYVEVRE